MTPKEKAEELVSKYRVFVVYADDGSRDPFFIMRTCDAAKCAIVAVDEILDSQPTSPSGYHADDMQGYQEDASEYWQEVKNELTKMNR